MSSTCTFITMADFFVISNFIKHLKIEYFFIYFKTPFRNSFNQECEKSSVPEKKKVDRKRFLKRL